MAYRADYTHKIETHKGRQVIVIVDLNIGSKPVTEDIENVVAEIAALEKIDPCDHLVVYRDCIKVWDGYDYRTKEIVLLHEDSENWRDAASLYIQFELNKQLATT